MKSGSKILVSGRVLDPSGAPIAGARVYVARGYSADSALLTDGSGHFALALAAGNYVLGATAEGFHEGRLQLELVPANPIEAELRLERDS